MYYLTKYALGYNTISISRRMIFKTTLFVCKFGADFEWFGYNER